MEWENILLYSCPVAVLSIAYYAAKYANELDRDIGQLHSLKYENRGA